jgi:general secretion pathway protein E
MKDLGVPPFLLAQSLLGVMAQRLLRRVCEKCAQPTSLTPDQLAALKAPLPLLPGGVELRAGAGCVRCRNTGFYGRVGVFEMLPATEAVRQLIAQGAAAPELYRAGREGGLRTLREAAVRKLAQGATAFEEVIRITSN